MKFKQPSASEKRWREAVRDIGSILSGGPAVIHHPIGRTGKHNKIAIGQWWVIPLTDKEHKALHNGETFGHESRKEFEKWAFMQVLKNPNIFNAPISAEVGDAIMGYKR